MITFTAIAIKLNILTFAACSSAKDVMGGTFFGLPPWWEYIKNVKVDGLGQCVPDYDFSKNFNDVLSIGLAIIDIMLRLAGFLAVVAVILAGIHYVIAVGNPEKTRSARRSLVNALIGLSIAMVAVGLVKFIGTRIGG